MKKFLALLLALTMVLSLGTVAFAAKTAPVEGSNHTYTAYQIFSGTQAARDAALADIDWGTGIKGAEFLAALKADAKLGDTFATCENAADVANAMKDWADKSDNAKAFAKLAEDFTKGEGVAVVNGQTVLDAGYYLVVDTTETVGAQDAYNVALLQLTQKGVFEIQAKNEVPEVEKKIVEGDNRVDANHAAIGSIVNYEIKTAVPTSTTEYDYYFFIIRDTLSAGLTFNKDIKVTIGGKDAVEGTDYSVKYGEDGYTFQIALIDAKANSGKAVVVTYSAEVNKNAIVGIEGNPNEVDVKYSNNPNEDSDKIPHDKDKPGFPADKTYNPGGVTPKDITLTYTTELRIYKVDQDGKALQGAEFTLSGDGVKKTIVAKEAFVVAENGEYWKLKDGSFTKDEPITADKMEAAQAGAKNGYVLAEDGFDGEVITIDGVDYRVVNADETAAYVLVKANADLYESTTVKYNKDTQLVEVSQDDGKDTKVVGTVDENGNVVFSGLDAGEYTLSETKTPAGYNTIDDIEFTINCKVPSTVVDGEETCEWSVNSKTKIAYNELDNAFEITVVNQKGGELPETGGIGTTIFYVVGAVLVAAAGVLLITKKRMGAEG